MISRTALLSDMVRVRRMEEKCAELYGEAKIRGFLHLYVGEEAVAAGSLRALTAEDAVVATYREHAHALLCGLPDDVDHGRDVRQAGGLLAGQGRVDAPVRRRHPVLRRQRDRRRRSAAGGGSGAGRRDAASKPGHRLLFRRRRRRRRRVPRVAEHGRAVAAAGRCSVAKTTSTRWAPRWNGRSRRPTSPRRRRRTRCPPSRSTGWTSLRATTRRNRAPTTSAPPAARSSSSSAPIDSARTRCSTRSCIATRPRSRSGASATRSGSSPSRCLQDGTLTADDVAAIEAAADQEVDDAVAFADAGTWESVDDLERDVLHPDTGGWHDEDDIPHRRSRRHA